MYREKPLNSSVKKGDLQLFWEEKYGIPLFSKEKRTFRSFIKSRTFRSSMRKRKLRLFESENLQILYGVLFKIRNHQLFNEGGDLSLLYEREFLWASVEKEDLLDHYSTVFQTFYQKRSSSFLGKKRRPSVLLWGNLGKKRRKIWYSLFSEEKRTFRSFMRTLEPLCERKDFYAKEKTSGHRRRKRPDLRKRKIRRYTGLQGHFMVLECSLQALCSQETF